MDCTGVYDTDGNLTNVTISAEKTAEILSYDFTGNGTANDPYQVNTTNGFWYMSKFVDLTGKYVELNCDVVLNDEMFDENGNASAGDGVVYSWETIKNDWKAVIDGNDHVVYGLYLNDESRSDFAMFNGSMNRLANLSVTNLYIHGNENLCSFTQVRNITLEITNCHVLRGTIRGNYVAGICNTGYVSYCTNRANIYTALGCGGIARKEADVRFCVNYGNIYAENDGGGNYIGGILQSAMRQDIYNCTNYGNIIANKAGTNIVGIGGISGLNSKNSIYNCDNYGNFDLSGLNSSNGGGIAGYLYDSLTKIYSCNNYGNLYRASGIAGYGNSVQIYDSNNYGNISRGAGLANGYFSSGENGDPVIFKNCKVYGDIRVEDAQGIFVGSYCATKSFQIIDCVFNGNIIGTGNPYFGVISYTYKTTYKREILLKNVKINAKVNYTTNEDFIFLGGYGYDDEANINLKVANCDFNVAGNVDGFRLLGGVGKTSSVTIQNITLNYETTSSSSGCFYLFAREEKSISIKNVQVKCKMPNSYYRMSTFLFLNKTGEASVDGVIADMKFFGGENKIYCGENFGAYRQNWKTGEIINSITSPVGAFYGIVNVQVLQNAGYSKFR